MTQNKFTSKRAPFYTDVPDEKWNDWRWQMANRLNSVDDFEKILNLTASEKKALNSRWIVSGGYHPLLRFPN